MRLPRGASRTHPLTAGRRPDPTGCFSCVVDDHPRFHLDAIRWFTTLTVVAGVDPHDSGRPRRSVGRPRMPSTICRVTASPSGRSTAFDPRSPHCNKISGALRLAEDRPDGIVVLCDTDVVVLDDPRGLAVPADAVAGKPVDAPVPPYDVILAIFEAAGVAPPPPIALPWGRQPADGPGNSNGGLYLIPGPLLPGVAPAWARWARWLLDRLELLEQWTVYIDQVAMAMAIWPPPAPGQWPSTSVGTPRPTTRPPSRPDAAEPSIIHYHQQVDRRGRLLPTGVPSIDRRIDHGQPRHRPTWPDGFPHSDL